MKELSVRKMQLNDLPNILLLLADDELGKYREEISGEVHQNYIKAFNAINTDSNQFLAVFEKNNEIVGCLQLAFIPSLTRHGGLRGQIEGVRVSSKLRGKGYGRQMISWAIEKCRQQGCTLIQLTSDKSRKEAFHFYQNLGFSPSHEGFKMQI